MADHTCTVCQKTAPWDEGWMWYGSYNDIDGGDPRMKWKRLKPIVKTCSDVCRTRAVENNLVPAGAKYLDDGDK